MTIEDLDQIIPVVKNGKEAKDETRPIWTRYALWLLVPIMLALYFSQESIVLADIKHERQVLPTLVKPVHYDLNLTPNLSTFVYDGSVKVSLQVLNDTSVIVLNANELTIDTAIIFVRNISLSAIDIQFDNKTDQVSLTFGETLVKGSNVQLLIEFQGVLNDHMSGFYRSSFKNSNGSTSYLATTQFEATDARRAFPCWDEPSLKATFDVTLNVPSDLTALSNMDVISDSPAAKSSPGLKTVKYATTPLMSTYLLAFIVGPFEYIEGFTTGEYNGRPIKTRVYTLPGLSTQGRHALNVAMETLEYFAKVFDLPYPLPKLDMVAIPDFDAGAMENWGLVTFRTTALLYDEKNSAFIYKRSTAYTVAHELAHQWFGNLVTMEWWDHLWLNEGFATWVGWFAIDHIFPDWQVWTMFATQNMQDALNLDGLRSSHPVEVAVNNPSEIHQIFDSISYMKGASVIRMVNSWLTTQTFLKGIHSYLNHHRLGNAATNDLWAALSETAGKNVSEFMNTWTQKTGYPVVNIELNGKNQILITQARYLLTGDLGKGEDDTTWWVPLRIKVPEQVLDYTLKEKSKTFVVPDNAPLKLNQGQTSLYRVNYSKELMTRLINELKKPDNGILSEPTDRAGILSDLGVLSRSGEQNTVTFLSAAAEFKDEKNYFVLAELTNQLSHVVSLWEGFGTIEPRINKIRRDIYAPLAKQLGWESKQQDEAELDKLLRVLAISEAGLSGDENVIAEAKSRFEKFINGDHSVISPDLRYTVFKISLKQASSEAEETKVWESIFAIYSDESFPIDQNIIALQSLGTGIKYPSVITKTLNLILDEKQVRTQDAWMFFRALGNNNNSRKLLIKFFQTNYEKIYQRFSKSMGSLGNAVNNMISDVNDVETIGELESFFSPKDVKEYSRSLNGGLEKAKVNAAQIQREQADMIKWAK
ncbi:peptidase family M1-domain-containing protein [Helicostylum pulchrum]|nr:peptidase family M1-domain-containing protein [Helicostylum pulchrum]